MNIWHIVYQSWCIYIQETGFRNVTFINIKYVFPQLTSICITIWKTHLLLVWESNEQACFIWFQIEKLIWTNRNVLEELAPSRQKQIHFIQTFHRGINLNLIKCQTTILRPSTPQRLQSVQRSSSDGLRSPCCSPDTNVFLWFQCKHSHKGSSQRGTLIRIVVFNELQTLHTCPLSPLTPRQVFWSAQVMTAVKLSTLYRGNIISNRSIWNDLRSDISRQFCGLWFMLLHGWRKLALSHDQSSQAGWFCRWLLVKLAQSSVRGLSQWWFILWQQNEDQINHKVQKLVTLQSVVSLIPDKVPDFTSNNHSSVMY